MAGPKNSVDTWMGFFWAGLIALAVGCPVWFYDRIIAGNFWVRSWFLAIVAWSVAFILLLGPLNAIPLFIIRVFITGQRGPGAVKQGTSPYSPRTHSPRQRPSNNPGVHSGTGSSSYTQASGAHAKTFAQVIEEMRNSSRAGAKKIAALYDRAQETYKKASDECNQIADATVDELLEKLQQRLDSSLLKDSIIRGDFNDARVSLEDIIKDLEELIAALNDPQQSGQVPIGQKSIEDDFKILGLPVTATGEEVKERWKRLSKILHPDLNPGADDSKVKEINAAYERLKEAKQIS